MLTKTIAVYGAEGKISSRYLEATRSVLRDIAGVAEQVNSAFNVQTKKAFKGISRVAAHIHLLQHQVCIIGQPNYSVSLKLI